ncbi:hypothetical protein [Glycomyces buryatensis]|nr:hypothetical protein [Glycomyces buryatensis]
MTPTVPTSPTDETWPAEKRERELDWPAPERDRNEFSPKGA